MPLPFILPGPASSLWPVTNLAGTPPVLAQGGGGLPSINAIFAKATSSLWLTASPASKLKTTSTGDTSVAVALDPVGKWVKTSGTKPDPIQATAGARPFYGLHFVEGDLTRFLAAATGGGETGPFWFLASQMNRANAAAQRIFGDRNGNNGRLFQIAGATNRVQLVGGNGASLVTASPVATLTPGKDEIIEGWYDGTNLAVAIDGGTPQTAALGVLTGGATGFGILANSDGTSPAGGRDYDFVWSQGYVPTSDERTAARAELIAWRNALNAASDTPRYYIDSVAGNDSNDGLFNGAAKATWADTDADYTFRAYDVFGLKRDGSWKEKIVLGTDMKLVGYGTGTEKPEVRGDTVIDPGSFSTTAVANVYKFTLAQDVDALAAEWPALFDDTAGVRFTFSAVDLTSVSGDPYTFWHGDPSGAASLDVYVHCGGDSDPRSDGKTLSAPTNARVVDLYDATGATIKDVRTRRPGASYGSITLGRNCTAIDSDAIEGNTHALFARSGARVSGGRQGDCYNHTTSPTIFIAYDNNPVAAVTVEDVEFFQTVYDANVIGVYMHAGAGTFPGLNLARNTFDNIGLAIAAANCTHLTSVDDTITNFLTGFKPGCDATFTRLNLSSPKSGGFIGISDAAGITVVVDEATGVFNSTGYLRSVHNNTDFTLKKSTLTGMNQVLLGSGTGQRWTCRENDLIPNGRMYTIYDLPADVLANGNLDSDYNNLNGATGVWKIAGVTVATTLAEWQNYSGQDMHSVA